MGKQESKTNIQKVRPKKYLGQNFLSSPHYAKVMVEAAKITPGETVLEIGPGTGILTEEILRAGGKVIGIEKDTDLLSKLENKFQKDLKNGSLRIINQDVRKANLPGTAYALIANIPYNITGEILRLFLGGEQQPVRAFLMVQKEVANRVLGTDGKGSVLSMSVSCYGTPRKIATVGRGNFRPTPKVDSAIIAIENISRAFFKNRDEEGRFFKVLKTGFAHKRKMLLPNLSGVFGKKPVETAFTELKIDRKARAENMGLKEWLSLAKNLKSESTEG
ncbi:MAG: 16S rRNA (adenine(1518)-N(6)/adenine(1519)-N(6))-dimethyltransferase RsmA [Patescibacteria group bacterium]